MGGDANGDEAVLGGGERWVGVATQPRAHRGPLNRTLEKGACLLRELCFRLENGHTREGRDSSGAYGSPAREPGTEDRQPLAQRRELSETSPGS